MPPAARVRELEEILVRLEPILQNSKDAFQNPDQWGPATRGYRLEGLANGCRVGLEIITAALKGRAES